MNDIFPKDIRNEIKKAFDVRKGLVGPLCQTGEPYVELVQSGIKAEGAASDYICCSLEVAWKCWRENFWKYAEERSRGQSGRLRLYWRIKPESDVQKLINPRAIVELPEKTQYWHHDYYRIYSRLVITGQPELDEVEITKRLDELRRNELAARG